MDRQQQQQQQNITGNIRTNIHHQYMNYNNDNHHHQQCYNNNNTLVGNTSQLPQNLIIAAAASTQNHHHLDHHHQHMNILQLPSASSCSSSPFLLSPNSVPASSNHIQQLSADSLSLGLGKRHYYDENATSGSCNLAGGELIGGNNIGLGMMRRWELDDDDDEDDDAGQQQQQQQLGHDMLIMKRAAGEKKAFLHNIPPPPQLPQQAQVGVWVVVPKCQVEGCNVGLMSAKEYHKRHKVCAMHAKAPQVVVQGLNQRFCQQCSRFHVVTEFDDAKRSCRRRLAGHNERRRKNSSECISRNNNPQETRPDGGRFMSSSTECALSLLSSKNNPPWVPPTHNLSSRSSAALRELIAENRAIQAKQLCDDQSDHEPTTIQQYDQRHCPDEGSNSYHHQKVFSSLPHQVWPSPSPCGSFLPSASVSSILEPMVSHLHRPLVATTLDLMQVMHPQSSTQYGLFLSRGGSSSNKSDLEENDCEIWRPFE